MTNLKVEMVDVEATIDKLKKATKSGTAQEILSRFFELKIEK